MTVPSTYNAEKLQTNTSQCDQPHTQYPVVDAVPKTIEPSNSIIVGLNPCAAPIKPTGTVRALPCCCIVSLLTEFLIFYFMNLDLP